jgi:hypothetical protein
MKNTKLHTSRIARTIAAASAAVIVCFAFTAISTQADPSDNHLLLISFDENFTGPTTIDGTTTLAGAFSDKGSRHQDFTTTQNGNVVTVTGTINITGGKGTLKTQFTGTIDVRSNPTLIEGTEYIIAGTGIYAGASGKGSFEATIDFDTGNIVGVAELDVKAKK